ncbi:MAG: HigA family addiction module antidote protein [Proteobacteria bacterium]|nr:HigA family addiction module antidote protein [Pseudomonadota bacterium]
MRVRKKTKSKIKPVHPGSIIKTEFMKPLGLSNYALAKASGISEAHIGRIIRGLSGLTAEVALRLEGVFGVDAQTWINLQTLYDLEVATHKSGKHIARTVKRIDRKGVEEREQFKHSRFLLFIIPPKETGEAFRLPPSFKTRQRF